MSWSSSSAQNDMQMNNNNIRNASAVNTQALSTTTINNVPLSGVQTFSLSQTQGVGGGIGTNYISNFHSLPLNTAVPALNSGSSTTIQGLTAFNADGSFSFAQAGTFKFDAFVTAYQVGHMQCVLWDESNGHAFAYGTSGYSTVSTGVSGYSQLSCVVNIPANTIVGLQLRITSSHGANDLGLPGNFGTEVYSYVTITQIM
jgi:hypothetical protein